jgi:hypothetical protein
MSTSSTSLDIHRLLDEAFIGIDVTPDVQDLKEEMRGNLVARVAELRADGVAAGPAAQRAMAELGDVRAILADMPAAGASGQPGSWTRHRVRPKPAFVIRTVVTALIGAAALAAGVLMGVDVLPTGSRPTLDWGLAVLLTALAGAWLVRDALGQETTTNYPVPRGRARGYGIATLLALGGLGSVATYLPSRDVAWLIAGAAPLLAAIVWFTYLGATQTNRHKPWVVHLHARHAEAGDRFEQDPAAAARFGIYTVVIWLVALTAFGVLGFAVGWAWSWLALLGGVIVFMLTLARMLFGAGSGHEGRARSA